MTRIVCAGFLFDMDGVLVDSTPAVARVWSRWAVKYGLDPVFITKKAHGRPSLATIQDLLPDASPELHQKENEWMEREEIDDVIDVVALPGALGLLSRMPQDQFAVVTSATRALAEVRLGAAGLLKFTRHLITWGDITHGKPHPEPYLKGAAALGLLPEDCVVIEDAPSGVRSGKAAGARVIGLRTTTTDEELQAAGIDWIVNDCSTIHLYKGDPRNILFELVDIPELRRQPKMS